jgi:5,10-methylenetetrahydrofolate reductase
VPHGRDLREILAEKVPELSLGGWVNPHRDAQEQVRFLAAPDAHAAFALSQVVSHHSLHAVDRFHDARAARGIDTPVVFGVFFYRSANPRTLEILSRFFPVPVEEVVAEFERGDSAEEVCARSIRALRKIGADKIYVSNLGERRAGRRLRRILELV